MHLLRPLILLVGLLAMLGSAMPLHAETLVIRAFGSPSGGAWPNMRVWVNGTLIGETTVGDGTIPPQTGSNFNSAPADYPFTFTAPAGQRLIVDVAFTNDANSDGQDRNLYLQSLTLPERGLTLPANNPAAPFYQGQFPPNVAAANTVRGNVQGGIYWTGTFRFSTEYFLVGPPNSSSCPGANYTTVGAALQAAAADDIILICPGTYNEALRIDKNVILASWTGNRDVIIAGGSQNALTLAADNRLTVLRLLKLDFRSNAKGIYAEPATQVMNALLFDVSATTVGDAFDFSAANLNNFNSSVTSVGCCNLVSTAGSALKIKGSTAYPVYIVGTNLTAAGPALIIDGPSNALSRQTLTQMVINTSGGSDADGVRILTGVPSISDVFINAAGRGIDVQSQPNHTSYYTTLTRVTINSGNDGVRIGDGLIGRHEFYQLVARAAGTGARGIAVNAGLYLSNSSVTATESALVIQNLKNNYNYFAGSTLISQNAAGIDISGNVAVNNWLRFGLINESLNITAKTVGIKVDALLSTGGLMFENLNINGVEDGIVTTSAMAGEVRAGLEAPVTIQVSREKTGVAGWGMNIPNSRNIMLKALTVDSVSNGIFTGTGASSTIQLQGTELSPLTVTAKGTEAYGIQLLSGVPATLSRIKISAPAGYGLRTEGATSTIEYFDIQSAGNAIQLTNQPNDLTIRNGSARATRNGAHGILMDTGTTCTKTKNISDVTATAGDGGRAIHIDCGSSVTVNRVCARNGLQALSFGSAIGPVTVSNSSMNAYSQFGLKLDSSRTGSSITGNCFNTITSPLAQSTAGQSFLGNYWAGVPGSYVSGNINDSNALSSCPNNTLECPVAPPTARLLAAYDFEDPTTWTGASGEVLDTAGVSNTGYPGQAIGSTLPTMQTTAPARPGSTGTCGYGDFTGPAINGTAIQLSNLPVNTSLGAKTTVAFWMYANAGGRMPFGFNRYDLYFAGGGFGFNTGVGDVYAFSDQGLYFAWHHVVAVFTNGDVAQNKIYIDGIERPLTASYGGTNGYSNGLARVTSDALIGGWTINTSYRFSGKLDQFRIYDGELTADQVTTLYQETHRCGGQLIAQYRFEETPDWNGTTGELIDTANYTGGPFNGKAIGQPMPVRQKSVAAKEGSKGTCSFASLPGPISGGGAFEIPSLPLNTAIGAQTSVAFWMYWDGQEGTMPFGFPNYDLFLYAGRIGFNTGNSDVFGASNTGLANGWHHIAAVFNNGDITQNQLYIDGVLQSLSSTVYGTTTTHLNRNVGAPARIGGWPWQSGYRFSGKIDEVKIFNGPVSAAQVLALSKETHPCSGNNLIAEWRMDERDWAKDGQVAGTVAPFRGNIGAVIDSGPNALHGTAHARISGNLPTTTPKGKVCGAGDFTKEDNHVDIPPSIIEEMTGPRTTMAWVKVNVHGSYNYLFSNARDCCGYYRGVELRVGSNGQPNWQTWDTTQQSYSFGSAVNTGEWQHIAVTYDGTSLRGYQNGVLKSTVTATRAMTAPPSFRTALAAMGHANGVYDLNGYLDEVKIWDRALSTAEIGQIYTNENAGLHWDGTVRDCGNIDALADWHLDEYLWSGAEGEVRDTLANAHATAAGGASSSAEGKVCRGGDLNAALVDGQRDYLAAKAPANLSNTALSMSMWVKFDSLQQESQLMYIRSNTGRYFYVSTWRPDYTGEHNGLHAGGLYPDGGWGRTIAPSTAFFTTGRWYHIVFVADYVKGRLTAYRDGVPIHDVLTSTGPIAGIPEEIWIGSSPEVYQVTDGKIDEVLLFNGALSRDQVAAIYANQSAARNWDGSPRTCPTQPGTPGKLNAFESSTVAGAISGNLYTKLAGAPYAVDLVALNTTASAVDNSFNQSVKVEVLGSNDITLAIDAANCPVSGTTRLSEKPYAVTGGRTTVKLPAEANAWRNVRLRLSYPAAGTPLTTVCANDNFAIRPAATEVLSSAQTSFGGAAGTPILAAGSTFTVSASNPTPNYNAVLALDSSRLTAQDVNAASKQAGGMLGTLNLPQLTVNGSAQNAQYDEAGYLYLAPGTLRDNEFTKVDRDQNDCITDAGNASSDFLSATPINGKVGCSIGNTSEVVLGRFVPAYLSVTPLGITHRADLPGCSANASYYGEDFTTRFALSAHGSSGSITRNYSALYARLNPTDRSRYNGLAATGAASGTQLLAGTVASSGSFSAGQASVALTHKVVPGTASRPLSAITADIKGSPVDSDGVTVLAAPATLGSVALREGRAHLFNAHGAELLDLPQPFQVEYWGGLATGWRVATDDQCSTAAVSLSDGYTLFGGTAFAASNSCVLGTSNCNTDLSARRFNGVASNGKFNLWLKATGTGRAGSLGVTGQVADYLQYDWQGTVTHPSAKATFGIRRSSPVLIRRDIRGGRL